jgi:hypothetical protein
MTNEIDTENGALDYLENDWDFCPVCGAPERECTCPAEDAPAPAAPVSKKSGDGRAYCEAEGCHSCGARISKITGQQLCKRHRDALKAPAAPAPTYATLEDAKAVGPQGSHIRLNAIKTYLREQREAKRAAKAANA